MRIKKTVVETVEVERTEDILCNKCGQSLRCRCDMNYEGLIEARIVGGYGSKLGDMTPYQFSLCEDCLKVLFETFMHEPINPDDYVEESEDDEC